MSKTKPTSPFDASKLTDNAIQTMDDLVHQAANGERAWFDASVQTWSIEMSRYYDELVKQTTSTLEGLRTCQTPFDVLKVEQEWWAARSKAYMDSGVRLARTLSEATTKFGGMFRS